MRDASELRRIVAQVLYHERAKTGLEADTAFDQTVAQLLDRIGGDHPVAVGDASSDDGLKRLKFICRLCGSRRFVVCRAEGFRAWRRGTHIQEAMPELSADERELMLSHTCEACWHELFGEEL